VRAESGLDPGVDLVFLPVDAVRTDLQQDRHAVPESARGLGHRCAGDRMAAVPAAGSPQRPSGPRCESSARRRRTPTPAEGRVPP
jgi:hypothetical protein